MTSRALRIQPPTRAALRAAPLCLLLAALCAAGALGEQSSVAPEGRWRRARQAPPKSTVTEEQQREIERLESLAYLTGTKPAPASSGVTLHDARSACPGYNFYTSGHFPGAVLMDMDGKVLHTWGCEFTRAFPEAAAQAGNDGAKYWHAAHLCANGDVIAVYDGLGIVRLDKDSRVLWSNLNRAHHDVDVLPDGTILTLTREGRAVPGIDTAGKVVDDYVVTLDGGGRELARVSLLEAFLGTEHERVLRAGGPNKLVGDVLHANSVDLLDGSLAGKIPGFRKGNVLISAREFSVIAVLDMASGEIVWAATGSWRAQHDAKQVPGGTVLLFDNKGGKGASRVLEHDPVAGELAWSYGGKSEQLFFSELCGAVERLPNGNTLVTESDPGRAFEVTREGRVVWEFLNPERAGEGRELIATIFQMERLPGDRPLAWLTGP